MTETFSHQPPAPSPPATGAPGRWLLVSSVVLICAGGLLFCAGVGSQVLTGTSPALQGSGFALPLWLFAVVAGCGGLVSLVGVAGVAGILGWRWRVTAPRRAVRAVVQSEYQPLLLSGALEEVPVVVPELARLRGQVAKQPVLVRLLREHHRLGVAIESTYLHSPLPPGARLGLRLNPTGRRVAEGTGPREAMEQLFDVEGVADAGAATSRLGPEAVDALVAFQARRGGLLAVHDGGLDWMIRQHRFEGGAPAVAEQFAAVAEAVRRAACGGAVPSTGESPPAAELERLGVGSQPIVLPLGRLAVLFAVLLLTGVVCAAGGIATLWGGDSAGLESLRLPLLVVAGFTLPTGGLGLLGLAVRWVAHR